ncbi:hypothetical protein HII36_53760, partial [Nonomuraea sp. NN258]|uniref:WXG100-like domain-containing protein n=1 Tax=Nonomuraea antri TaxID=2730852 RepID=UPI001569D880
MWLDGMEIPGWLRPWVGWVVGSDWPEGDERVLFRLADALLLAANKVAAGADGDGVRLADGVRGSWDGDALKAFVQRVDREVGGRRAELVGRLVTLAQGLNQLGVQVQYTKRMIKLAVMLFVVQMLWLAWALVSPVGGVTAVALFGVRAQAARWTVRQFAQRLMLNVVFFGGLMGGMDLYVQSSQSRRDGIDWGQVRTSAGLGAMTGGLLTGLAWALPTRSLWMLMGQSGVASAGATLTAEILSGRPINWETVAKGFTSGVLGGADAHWASWSPHAARTGDGPAAAPHSAGLHKSPDSPLPDGPAHLPEGSRPEGSRPEGRHESRPDSRTESRAESHAPQQHKNLAAHPSPDPTHPSTPRDITQNQPAPHQITHNQSAPHQAPHQAAPRGIDQLIN